jgi:hypothetical protein
MSFKFDINKVTSNAKFDKVRIRQHSCCYGPNDESEQRILAVVTTLSSPILCARNSVTPSISQFILDPHCHPVRFPSPSLARYVTALLLRSLVVMSWGPWDGRFWKLGDQTRVPVRRHQVVEAAGPCLE